MANESFSISEVIPARPERIYAAWMNSEEHTAFTGDAASVEAVPGGPHSAFGGYARGVNLELQEGRRIVQTWRTTQFPTDSPDSRLEVTLEETVGGTMLTIFHSEIPSGQSTSYRQGWEKYYLEALKRYFNGGAEAPDASAEAPSTIFPVQKPAKKVAKPTAKPTARTTAKAAVKTAAKTGGKTPSRKMASKAAKKKVSKSAKKSAKPAKRAKAPKAAAKRTANKAAKKTAKKTAKTRTARVSRTKDKSKGKGKGKSPKPARRRTKKRR